MREFQNMQLMLPRIIRESLRSEGGNSLENPMSRNNRPVNRNFAYQTPFNIYPDIQPQAPLHQQNNPQMPQQQQRQPNVAQQLFGSTPRNNSEQYPGYENSPHLQGYKPITPNQLEKWGIRYDGTNKNLTEDVTSPSCPRCVGNRNANTRKTGPACSEQQTNQ